MWPLPPIHKSSAGHGWRAGLRGARRSGGRGLRRARRQQENKRAAGASLRSCVRGSAAAGSGAGLGAAGAVLGRGGLRRGVLRGTEPGRRGRFGEPGSGERGSGHWRRSLPGSGRAAKDTCRLPELRRAGASAQRPGARLLRSGGAGSHAIHASAHLRAGRRPWLSAASLSIWMV
ncbi:shadow of prion protein-like [Equus quagga]|uniref:shadow of prion protein-like n=1 Tax=Equus quagga TaxID=89248 RepID=UPI001EE1D7A4|nr:shadow of prion protein-like [Equus quagga]